MTTNRPRIPAAIESMVLRSSKRNCALCFGLKNDLTQKPGQIAHLNKDRTDNRFENLAWLCFEHHDSYDSTTSQSKNYTLHEVKAYRDQLYSLQKRHAIGQDEIAIAREYLRENAGIFGHLFERGSELAYAIDSDVLQSIADLLDSWASHRLRSFSTDVRSIQDGIASELAELRSIYDINQYDLVGNYIKFNSRRFSGEVLQKKKSQARDIASALDALHSQLVALAT